MSEERVKHNAIAQRIAVIDAGIAKIKAIIKRDQYIGSGLRITLQEGMNGEQIIADLCHAAICRAVLLAAIEGLKDARMINVLLAKTEAAELNAILSAEKDEQ